MQLSLIFALLSSSQPYFWYNMDKFEPITLAEAYTKLNSGEYDDVINICRGICPIYKFYEEYVFDEKEALTFLMITDVIELVGNNWWQDKWPEEAKNCISLSVIVSDQFFYACADAESVKFSDIKSLFLWSVFSPRFGYLIWASVVRGEMPVVEMVDSMEKSGIPFREMAAEWGLRENACNKVVPRW